MLFLQDGGEDGAESAWGEGKMEDVAYLIERVAAQVIQVQHFPIGCFLDKDGLSAAVLVAAGDVVVKGELGGGRDSLGLGGLLDRDVLPFIFALIFQEI